MSKKKPEILLEKVDPETYKSTQILSGDHLYSVCYRGKPINMRTLNKLVSYPGPRYKKTVYTNEGYAKGLARRLNEMFDTDEFTVVKLTPGTDE